MNNFLPQKRGMQVVWIIVGCLIYAVGLNVFIIPMNLYSGGAVGLAQLLSYGAGQIGIKEIAGLNLYGIIYLLLNIPILFIAWFKIGKTFFINTILGTVGISLFTSIVPSPATAVIADPVIGIIIGGVVTGAGIGIMLTAKGSGGGIEVIGIWMAKKYHTKEEIIQLMSELTGQKIDESFGMFPPFYTDCGRNIHIGKNVFINAGCKFQDQGGIYIEDGVLIGHNAVLATINHMEDPEKRAGMIFQPIHHRLAEKKKITLDDLAGENFMLMQRGWSYYGDRCRSGRLG